MTPTVPELLLGNFLCLIDPPPNESVGDYLQAKIGVTGMISMLCAQEAERGVEARAWENRAIRELLQANADRYGQAFAQAAEGEDRDLSLAAMDRANAGLRRALIELHVAVEAARDAALDDEIRALYVKMADARRLDLPPMPAS
ncbi:hypothetical protein [Caulobacter mirabilis]|uniref:Uncharacterized protein n=1 Tax=Caulobacter mirabilis TaxID=69666 RepID=A0A2D2B0N3_9CAUL|nr:hypothetical protein [Caulobacter mirabilis]ATQ43737.1 hypothetical protein CSW64_15715 [Caulobacter mirabilis]